MIVRELVARLGYSFDKADADRFDQRVKDSRRAAEAAVEAVKREAASAKEAAEAEVKARRRAVDEKIRAARDGLVQTQRAIEAEIRSLTQAEGETKKAFRERVRAAKESARDRIVAAKEAARVEIEAAEDARAAIAKQTASAVDGYAKKVAAAREAARERVAAEEEVIRAEQKADEKRTAALEKGRERLRGFLEGVGNFTKRAVQAGAVGAAALGTGAIMATEEKQAQLGGLRTQLGSDAAAEREFARLKAFGRASGIGGSNAISAFTRLRGLGVSSDDQSITGFANIAAGTAGKNTNDIIEAVADAATGEFERLKEFGFKASSQGDQVAITFRGVTTTIEKNGEAITKYLTDIGNNEFGGAVERRGKSLTGSFERLKESASDFLVAIGEGGLGKAVAEIAKKLDTTTAGGKALAAQLGDFLARAARQLFDLFMQGLPLFVSFLETVMGLIDAVGGPKGLIMVLVAGKTAMASMNLAMTAMTSGGNAAAGALRGIALAGGAAAAALAGAAVIVGHFEEKINKLKAAAREDSLKNLDLQKRRVAEADDQVLGEHIRQFREGISANEEKKRRNEARLAQLNGKRTSDLDEARAIWAERQRLTEENARLDDVNAGQQELLDFAVAEDARRFSESGVRGSRAVRMGQMSEDDAKAGKGYGPQVNATISGAEAERRRVRRAIEAEGGRLGATPEAIDAAIEKYTKARGKGDGSRKALGDAIKSVQTSVGYKAPKAGRKKVGTVDEAELAKFEADARAQAEAFGTTEAGIQEALDTFRGTQEYQGGNAAAARKAGMRKLRSVSGLAPSVGGGKKRKAIGRLDEEAYAAFEAEAKKRAADYGATDAGVKEALDTFREEMVYKGGNAAAAKKAGIDRLRSLSGLSGNDGLTITDMLDRDFGAGRGMPGGSPESRGGGGLGTTINRYDNTFSPTITVTIEVEQAAGEDGSGFADRVKEQVVRQVQQVINDGMAHFATRGS